MYFLASLPRSGSTLLGALLNQRSDMYVSPTSNLCDTLGGTIASWENNPATEASGASKRDLHRVLKGIVDARYPKSLGKIIVDKGRQWAQPQVMQTMSKVIGDVKIIATVRPVAECVASFVKVAEPDNIKEFCKDENAPLVSHFYHSYHSLKAGYEAAPDNFCLIEYDDLVKDPQAQLDRIADFLSIDRQMCNPQAIESPDEDDEVWGIKDLHKVRKKVSKRRYSAKKVLGDEMFKFFQGGEFWNDKPEPKRDPQLLDLELEASLRGDFDKAWDIAQELEKQKPDCDRAAFNRGWHLLNRGEFIKGHECLDRGRKESVFGNPPLSGQPRWAGEPGTVLLQLEGGLGDQIHGFRYAFAIKEKGNQVVVACSPELATLFKDDFITVQHSAAGGVYHDYYLPAMSAPLVLGEVGGKAYIKRDGESQGKVGVRWSGNPQFEHEQHRLFPHQLLWDMVQDYDCISLQKDGVPAPSWMETPSLETWEDTRQAISQCELVVTSCTSVAHLAGAMGVDTWIIVPILPYYLWALPGETTKHYDSVTLLRQTRYGSWVEPFEKHERFIAHG